MRVECQTCGRPVADQATVCATCAQGLVEDLADVADWIADELDTMLARLAVFGDRQAASSTSTPLPYDKAASEAVYVLRSTLVSTARLVAAERGLTGPQPAVRAIARPRTGDWTPHVPQSPQIGSQRCDQTDLPVDTCAHCRRAS